MKSAIVRLIRLSEELPGVSPDEKHLWKTRDEFGCKQNIAWEGMVRCSSVLISRIC